MCRFCFFSSRRRHTRYWRDWSSDVCSSDLVTANDSNDTDTGPNNLQNFPVTTSATRSNSTTLTTISGRLNSNPSQDYVIQCYLTNSGAASSHGEGIRLLDTEIVTSSDFNANGNARFSCTRLFPPSRAATGTDCECYSDQHLHWRHL